MSDAEIQIGSFPLGNVSGDPKEVMRRIRKAMESMGAEEAPAAPDPGAALELLLKVYSRYIQSYGTRSADECPFKPGDIVTPAPNTVLNNVSEPHIVLETMASTPDFENSESGPSSNTWGRRVDMRVACVATSQRDGSLCNVAHWVESFEFVLYDR